MTKRKIHIPHLRRDFAARHARALGNDGPVHGICRAQKPRTRCISQAVATCLCALLAFSICASPAFVQNAHAEVRKADVVMGSTVDSRGLAVAQCPSIEAEYAVLCEEDGTVYFERNSHVQTPIASITKVMTAVVALETAPMDTQVVVSRKAAAIGESSAGLREGDVLTLESALFALMIPSGNDAAQAIAETVGALIAPDGDGYAAFVQAMNDKAAELGMTDSVFENPHGLDFGSYAGSLHSTASDVALMCAYAMKNDTFRQLVNVEGATISVIRDGAETSVSLESTDELLGVYEGACGIKTGLTDLAGPSFAGACERGGRLFIAVVVNSASEEQRFKDATALFDWGFEHSIDYLLAHSAQTASVSADGQTKQVPVVAYVAHSEWVDCVFPATFSPADASVSVFDLNGNVSQSIELYEVTGDVHAGDVVGKATFKQRNNVIATADIVACEDARAPNVLEGVGVFFDRLLRFFSGQPQVAVSTVINETPLINDKTI